MQSSKHSDDGPMLQAEAAENASSLQIEKFAVSNGWMEAFRRRKNINFSAICGESANVDKKKQQMIGRGPCLQLLKDML